MFIFRLDYRDISRMSFHRSEVLCITYIIKSIDQEIMIKENTKLFIYTKRKIRSPVIESTYLTIMLYNSVKMLVMKEI